MKTKNLQIESVSETDCWLKQRIQLLLVLFLCCCSVFILSSALGQDQASVSTDKDYYFTGENVNISGSDWIPGEIVSLKIIKNETHTTELVNVQANAFGEISYDGLTLDDSNISYSIEASALSTEEPAYAVFTNSSGLMQAHNGGVGDPPVSPIDWVNGNAHGGNSHYYEGQSIPYRMILRDVTVGSHILEIGFDIRDGGNSAIDFITSNDIIEEIVDPIIDVEGPFDPMTTTDAPAPLNSIAANGFFGMQMQPLASFDALKGDDKVIKGYNCILDSAVYNEQGDFTLAHSQATILIYFHVVGATKDVVISWGGHISSRLDWGAENAATDINGSPYHTRLIAFDGKGGNQDRSLKTDAVLFKPICGIEAATRVCAGDEVVITASTDAPTPLYEWIVSGGTIIGPNDGSSISVQAGESGVISAQVVITDNSGGIESEASDTCGLFVGIIEDPLVNAGPDQEQCFGEFGAVFNLNGSISSGDAEWSILSGEANISDSSLLNSSVEVLSDQAVLLLTGLETCDLVQDTIVLTVNRANPLIINADDQPSCEDRNASYSSGDTGEGYSYQWSIEGDASIVGADNQSSVDVLANEGCNISFSLHLEVINADGCASEADFDDGYSDQEPPAIFGQGAEATISCPAVPEFAEPSVEDNCSGAELLIVSTIETPSDCPNEYSLERTWKAVDGCGNESETVSQVIHVIDNTPPSLSGQGANASISCPSIPLFTAPTASDACGNAEVVVVSDVTTPGDCAAEYSRTITWKAIDACGNESDPVSQTIDVYDNTAPNISEAGGGYTISCPNLPVFTPPSGFDDCGGEVQILEYSNSIEPFECPGTYAHTKSWVAVDECGNISAPVSQQILVIDNTPPVLSGQGPNHTISCPAEPDFTDPLADDECGIAEVILVSDITTPGDCANEYSRTKTWKAIDACGNESAPVSQTISVIDDTAPILSGVGGNETISCPGEPHFSEPSASDACGEAHVEIVSDVTTPGDCPAEYSRTITWKAVDACGNESAPQSQTINVVDNTAPILSGVGGNETISCPGEPQFSEPSASDACGEAHVEVVSDVTSPGDCPAEYSRTITWKAVDACGNESAPQSQTINVVDDTAPILSGVAGGYTVSCPNVPLFCSPIASDGCGDAHVVLVSDVTTPGECPAEYSRTLTWKAVDACGNESAPQSQTINVVDDTAPILSGVGGNETISCPGVPQFSEPSASDACGDAQVVLVSDVTTPGECLAEYSRTLTWKAVDACGNESAPQSQTINVIDNTAPILSGVGGNETISCPGEPQFSEPSASDACGEAHVVLVSDVTTPGDCPAEYSRTLTWKAVDACGNESASESQTINVIDNTAPILSGILGDFTVYCPNVPQFCAPIATDGCGDAHVVLVSDVTTPGDCPAEYSRTLTWKAVDACGNESAPQSQTINVVDNTAPLLGGVGGNETISCPAEPQFSEPSASDDCGEAHVVLVSDVTTPGDCPAEYSRTLTWKAVDACGNESAPQSQTINVIDNTAPLLGGVGANHDVLCPAEPVFSNPYALDECGSAYVSLVSDITTPGDCPNEYYRTKTWIAVDACGNESAPQSQTMHVIDEVAPVLSGVGGSETISCTEEPQFSEPSASDACGDAYVELLSDITTPGDCPAEYSRTKTWIAVDACGNQSAPQSQTINVIDNNLPILSGVGENQLVDCGDEYAFSEPSASDLCSEAHVVLVSEQMVGGECQANYSITRTWKAVDACGNESAPQSQTITVVDDEAPVIGDPGADYIASCPAVPVFTAPEAEDNCSDVTVEIVADEIIPYDCPGTYLHVRSWQAFDECGNASEVVTQQIMIIDETAPSISGQGDDDTISCSEEPEFTAPSASDECDDNPQVILVSEDTEQGDCPNDYRVTRTWKAVDACGNESEPVSQTINVIDNVPPTWITQTHDDEIFCPAEPEFTTPEAVDNCGSVQVLIVSQDTVYVSSGLTIYTTTWVAVDECGNASEEVSQTIERRCALSRCSLTQGFYGNAHGVACATGERGYDLIDRILDEYGDLVIGVPGRSLTFGKEDGPCIIAKLPAGSTPKLLPPGDNTFGADCNTGTSLDAKPRFNNVLLGQVITLGLNLRLDKELGDVQLEGTKLITIGSSPSDDGVCGTEDDIPVADELSYHDIPESILQALDEEYGDRSINSLFALANRVIGGEYDAVSLSNTNRACSAINEGFDECRFLYGFSDDKSAYFDDELKENEFAYEVFPNPAGERANVTFIATGEMAVKVELYSTTGALVDVLFNEFTEAHNLYNAPIDASKIQNGVYFVRITANNEVYQTRVVINK